MRENEKDGKRLTERQRGIQKEGDLGLQCSRSVKKCLHIWPHSEPAQNNDMALFFYIKSRCLSFNQKRVYFERIRMQVWK